MLALHVQATFVWVTDFLYIMKKKLFLAIKWTKNIKVYHVCLGLSKWSKNKKLLWNNKNVYNTYVYAVMNGFPSIKNLSNYVFGRGKKFF